jgi:hypothetical protein
MTSVTARIQRLGLRGVPGWPDRDGMARARGLRENLLSDAEIERLAAANTVALTCAPTQRATIR